MRRALIGFGNWSPVAVARRLRPFGVAPRNLPAVKAAFGVDHSAGAGQWFCGPISSSANHRGREKGHEKRDYCLTVEYFHQYQHELNGYHEKKTHGVSTCHASDDLPW